MSPGEKRFHRLDTLSKIFVSSGGDGDEVIKKALIMGVTMSTAKSYLNTIRSRYVK